MPRKRKQDPLPGRKSGSESIAEPVDRPTDPRRAPHPHVREEEAPPEPGRGPVDPDQGGRS